jgi:hypothetical protein
MAKDLLAQSNKNNIIVFLQHARHLLPGLQVNRNTPATTKQDIATNTELRSWLQGRLKVVYTSSPPPLPSNEASAQYGF